MARKLPLTFAKGEPLICRLHRVFLLAVLLVGCSHTATPFIRAGVPAAPARSDDQVDHRLLLIGDAGDPDPTGEPSLQLLAAQARRIPQRTTILFLGDNVYERGLPEDKPSVTLDIAADLADEIIPDVFDSRTEAERNLKAQIEAVRGSGAQAIFVPGNHDWDQFEEGGWHRILALERYLQGAAYAGANVSLIPPGGCPGPVALPLGEKAQVISLDTQWWLETRKDGKPTPDNNPTGCKYTSEQAIRDALVEQLRQGHRQGRKSIVVGHHPLDSEGSHGGHFDFDHHLFPLRMVAAYVPFYMEWLPLPIMGTAIMQYRACCSPSAQDMSHRRNEHMRAALSVAMAKAEREGYGPLLFAAGHDHTLQVFKGERGPKYTAVSGLGSSHKASPVGSNRRTLFAHSNPFRPGLMMVDFHRDGSVRLSVIQKTGDAEEGEETFTMLLTDPPGGGDSKAVVGGR